MGAPPRPYDRVLPVQADGRHWALPIASVLHVSVMPPLLPLPHAPGAFCGAVAWGREVLPVLDLAILLGGHDPSAAMLVVVRQTGRPLGLRVAAVRGVCAFSMAGAEPLDPDALDLPPGQPRALAADANRAAAADSTAAPPRRNVLVLQLVGKRFFLPLPRVVKLIDGAVPIPVPWAAPHAPALLMDEGEPLAIVHLHRLLGLRGEPSGPLVVCRAGPHRMAFPVDALPGIGEQGDATELQPELLMPVSARATRSVARDRRESMPMTAYLSILLAGQPCLLPLPAVRSVAGYTSPARLPHAPSRLLGMRARSGRILPVIDARMELGLPVDQPPLVDIELAPAGTSAFVLAAHQLDGVVRLAADALQPAGDGPVGGVARVGGRLAWLLSPQALAPRQGLAPRQDQAA